MIKWHNAQFVDFCMVFDLFFNKYCEIHVGNNKKHHVSNVLNCTCSFPSIDEYIKSKLCGLAKVSSFRIMASILQLTHGHSRIQKSQIFFIALYHPKKPTP
jgi:hypothetical protein